MLTKVPPERLEALFRRIQPAGSSARYESRVGDKYPRLICRTCRRMVDVDCAVGDTPCLTAANGSGYEIDEAEVIYWGRYPSVWRQLLSRPVAKSGHTACDTCWATQPWFHSNQGQQQ